MAATPRVPMTPDMQIRLRDAENYLRKRRNRQLFIISFLASFVFSVFGVILLFACRPESCFSDGHQFVVVVSTTLFALYAGFGIGYTSGIGHICRIILKS